MHTFVQVGKEGGLNARDYFSDVVNRLGKLEYEPKIVAFLMYDFNKHDALMRGVKRYWNELNSLSGEDMAIFTYDISIIDSEYNDGVRKQAMRDYIELSDFIVKEYGETTIWHKILKNKTKGTWFERSLYPFILFCVLDKDNKTGQTTISNSFFYKFTPEKEVNAAGMQFIALISAALDTIAGKNSEYALKSLENIEVKMTPECVLEFIKQKGNRISNDPKETYAVFKQLVIPAISFGAEV